MSQIRRTYSMMTVGFSGQTSNPVYIGDAAGGSLSLSLITADASSAYTVQGSNADGFTAAIPANTWSTMTVLGAGGIYAIQPGAAWLRAIESFSTSSGTLILSKQIGGC